WFRLGSIDYKRFDLCRAFILKLDTGGDLDLHYWRIARISYYFNRIDIANSLASVEVVDGHVMRPLTCNNLDVRYSCHYAVSSSLGSYCTHPKSSCVINSAS